MKRRRYQYGSLTKKNNRTTDSLKTSGSIVMALAWVNCSESPLVHFTRCLLKAQPSCV
jgi:hypothetical protein